MNYSKIDNILTKWANEKKLNIVTEYKDYEVRTVNVVDSYGNKYQIWLDPPNNDDFVNIHAWDYKTKRVDKRTRIDNLYDDLGNIYNIVLSWIKTKKQS